MSAPLIETPAIADPSATPPRKARDWRALLARRATQRIAIALGVLLASTSIGTGLAADDHFHDLLMRASPGIAGLTHRPLDLFVFADGNPLHNHQLMDEGAFPWWTDPSARLAFFRPLSSLTHLLDHALWPDAPSLMHLHSLLYYALLLALTASFYREIFPATELWIAGLALLLYALDDAHGPTVGWVANRNAILSQVAAMGALLLHHRRCRDLDKIGIFKKFASPLVLLVGLCAGEAALSAMAYLAAYALFLDDGPWLRRLLRLWPHVLVVLAWRGLYGAFGYGASGSGLYIDPARDPIAFAFAVAERLPILLLGQLALPWSDFWELYPILGLAPLRPVVMALALSFLAVFALLVGPLVARRREARFFALGGLLSALPNCATFPADRLLLPVGVGAMGLLAMFLADTFAGAVGTANADHEHRQASPEAVIAPATSGPRSRMQVIAYIFAIGFVAIHLVLAPLLLPGRARAAAIVNHSLARADLTLPDSDEIAQKTVILVNPPGDAFAAYLPIARASANRPRPKHLHWLATGHTALTVERIDARTLRVRPEGGFLDVPTEQLLRSPRRKMQLGEVVTLTAMTVTITALTDDARPAEAVFHFTVPLEDPSLRFMVWGDKGYVDYTPPRIGETQKLPAIDSRSAWLGLY